MSKAVLLKKPRNKPFKKSLLLREKAGLETSASFKQKIIKHKTYKENIIIHGSLQREGDN